MKKKIIIVVIIVIFVAAAAGAAFWFLGNKEPKEVISYYTPGDYFVTNIEGSSRLLKAAIVLELTTDKQEEYLAENNHIIRDVIVFTLREQTEESLRSSGIHDELREEIVANLEETMGIDYIKTLYFNDFVIQ